MDARRFRNHRAQPSDNFRWWGCVLLAMFALLQSDPSSPVSFPKPIVTNRFLLPPVGGTYLTDRVHDQRLRCVRGLAPS
jgi:hypothetical protein